MFKRILAIGFIFGCTTVAWFILSGAVELRTHEQNAHLRDAVGDLWGGPQVQPAPTVEALIPYEETVQEMVDGQLTAKTVQRVRVEPRPLVASDLRVALALEHRKKGLVWYPTYEADFAGRYTVRNDGDEPARYRIRYRFPEGAPVMDGFRFVVDGDSVDASIDGGTAVREIEVEPGETVAFRVAYRSQGVETWRYAFGEQTQQVRDFRLVLSTNFDAIDFPVGTLAATDKVRDGDGWRLTWRYDHLVADAGLGLALPEKLNPGPWVSRVTFFAPVSLFLFFFLLFLLSLMRGVRLHPMHYFFLGAAFFAFHLLLAYLVDHISVHAAVAICSVVSIGLVVSYMRLVTGARFALVEVGIAQLIYLVGFAYTFFLEGATGLTITVLCIVTLFGVMQLTGRLDWEQLFERERSDAPRPDSSAMPSTA
jgi:inner membrane protein involved in colicin E2 resistance